MENTKGVYKMNFDCGRQGVLTGVFVAEKLHVKILVENSIEVYFGEVLGKHSEVYGPIEQSEITLVSEDPAAIKLIEDLGLETGYNPFEYSAMNVSSFGVENEEWEVQALVEKIAELQ